MNEREQLARIKKLGVSNFETIKKVRRLQADMLDRLAASSLNPDRYAGLADCRADYCGRVNCLEACRFGTRRRRLNEISCHLRSPAKQQGTAVRGQVGPRSLGGTI